MQRYPIVDLKIKNKVALVAASSQGLGKAIALQLSKEGVKVAICARNEKKLFKARDAITRETGGEVLAYAVDVTKEDQIKTMLGAIVSDLGSIEILVNNAGGPPAGFIDDFSLNDYRNAIELNLISTIRLSYEVIPAMKEKKWGRIINITSVSAKQPIENLILSNTSRAGVHGFAKSLSNQLAPFGITVNSVCPGYTKTERVENLAMAFAEKEKRRVKDFYSLVEKNVPMNRIGKPEELAHTVAFLASAGAGYITGTAIQVDGGFIKGVS